MSITYKENLTRAIHNRDMIIKAIRLQFPDGFIDRSKAQNMAKAVLTNSCTIGYNSEAVDAMHAAIDGERLRLQLVGSDGPSPEDMETQMNGCIWAISKGYDGKLGCHFEELS